MFMDVANRELAAGKSDSVAFARAWGALKNAGYEKADDGLWRKVEKMASGQPRWPAGHPSGGQWKPSGATFGAGITAPQLGIAGGQAAATGKIVPKHGYPKATAPDAVANPDDVAVFTRVADTAPAVNGVAFQTWDDAPTTTEGWAKVAGQKPAVDADLPLSVPEGKRAGSGVIVEEPDGRVWVVEPTNHYGGYEHTFPAGGIEEGLSLQAGAIKEAFEESGLQVEVTGLVGDVERTTSVKRYYRARRVGGSPTDHGDETQAVKLVPRDDLGDLLNMDADQALLDRIDKVAKGGYTTQPRAPAGTPIGGQWVAGSIGMGVAFGMNGEPLIDPGAVLSDAKYNGPMKAKLQALNDAVAVKDWDAVKSFKPYSVKGKGGGATNSKQAVNDYHDLAMKYVDAVTKDGFQPKGAGDPVKLSSMTYDKPKPGGSAAGALYKDADGTAWLVKSYPDPDQAKSEVLAAKLYQAAGASAPDMMLVDLEGSYKGGTGVASKWESMTAALQPNSVGDQIGVQADFAADAWLANWDVIGLDYDNVRLEPGGQFMRVDPGGSLDYRAMGLKKGAAFGDQVVEWDTLRDPAKNAQAAAIFKNIGPDQLTDSAAKVTAVGDDAIRDLVDTYGPGSKAERTALADKLIARRNDVAAKAAKIGGATKTFSDPDTPASVKTGVASAVAMAPKSVQIDDFPKPGSATFYASKLAKIEDAATLGDFDKLDAELNYAPTSLKAQNSGNYKLFQAKAAEFKAWAESVHTQKGPGLAAADGPAAVNVGALAGVRAIKATDFPPPPVMGDVGSATWAKNKTAKLSAAVAAGDTDAIMAFKPYSSKITSPAAKTYNAYLADVQTIAAGGTKASDGWKASYASMATAKTPEAPKFDAGKLSAAPDFNVLGPGSKPLSSKAEVNAANNSAAAQIHAVAQKGDLAALDAMTFKPLDGGPEKPLSQHPSQHIKAYHANLRQEIDLQINPPRPIKIGEQISASDWDGGFQAIKPVTDAKQIAAVPKDHKAGKYIVLGQVQGKVGAAKADNAVVDSVDWKAKAKAHTKAAPESARKAFSHYVSTSGAAELNSRLRAGNLTVDQKAKVDGIKSLAVDIPEGTTFVRNMGMKGYGDSPDPVKIKELENWLMTAPNGTVVQEAGFTSASHGGGILGGNNIQWQFTAGKAVRAVPGWLELNPAEREALLLPNQRYMIHSAKKSGKTVVVKATLLPTLDD